MTTLKQDIKVLASLAGVKVSAGKNSTGKVRPAKANKIDISIYKIEDGDDKACLDDEQMSELEGTINGFLKKQVSNIAKKHKFIIGPAKILKDYIKPDYFKTEFHFSADYKIPKDPMAFFSKDPIWKAWNGFRKEVEASLYKIIKGVCPTAREVKDRVFCAAMINDDMTISVKAMTISPLFRVRGGVLKAVPSLSVSKKKERTALLKQIAKEFERQQDLAGTKVKVWVDVTRSKNGVDKAHIGVHTEYPKRDLKVIKEVIAKVGAKIVGRINDEGQSLDFEITKPGI